MASLPKVLQAVLDGRSDANIRFEQVRRLLTTLGFVERIKGDHHILFRDGIAEILNLQPLHGGKAKAYQVKQVRQVIVKYGLTLPRKP